MAKAVEITFAIGAALTGGFSGAFGKAGQALSQLQKQASSMEKQSGQITQFQKMQGTVARTATRLNEAKARAQKLGEQLKTTANPTQAMQKQFAQANAEVSRLQGKFNDQCKSLNALNSEMKAAGINTSKLKEEQARLAEHSQKVTQAQERLKNAQANYKSLKDQLSWKNIKGDLISSAAIGYALQKPVKVAAQFEQAMAQTRAVAFTGAGKSLEQLAEDEKNFQALRKQALQLGRDTQFSATQAANSQENLARAGFKTNEILASMPGLLNMAAAEGMDLANAADIAASTLRGFNMSADQMNHVADVLAQTSAASNTCITGLGESMKYVAPVASGLGITIEEVSAMLGVMGNAGIKGSEGGTALRGALLRLAQEPKAVSNALADLGIRAKTSTGKLRELPDLMTELSKKMHGWGEGKQMQYLSNIFGVRAASGMLAVMRGVADGSLKELERLDKESSGIMQAVVENINKAAGKTVVSVDEMRAGIENSEKWARRAGVSYDELQVYLGILAKQNIKGANADKVLTDAFTRLNKKPKELMRALKKYDISAFDKDGKLWGMPTLLRDLDKALKGMTRGQQLNVLEQIFGKGTGEAMFAMMQETVNGGFDSIMEGAKKTAKGISAIMAETRNDTLEGDLLRLGSAWEYLQIQIGDIFSPVARKGVQLLTQGIANLAELIEKFPAESKGIAYIVGALGGYKIARSVWKIGRNLLKLPGAWLEVVGASAEAEAAMTGNATVIGKALSGIMHPIDTLKTGFKNLWGLIMAHPFMALVTVAALILIYWKDICAAVQKAIDYMMGAQKLSQQEIKVKYSYDPALMRSAMTTGTMVNSQGQNKVSRTAEESATRAARTTGGRNKGGYQRRAAGGILTRPEFALVAEAGAEAIIPLTDKNRGPKLWFEAGRQLGLLDKLGLDNKASSSMSGSLDFKPERNIQPENYNAPLHSISRQLGLLGTSGVSSEALSAMRNTLKPEASVKPENYNAPLHNISRQLGLLDNKGLGDDIITSINALKLTPNIDVNSKNYDAPLGNISRQLGMLNTQPENSREGIPLWQAAGDNVSFDRSTTNNTTNTSTTNNNQNTMPAFAPVVNLTVNGGESGIDGKIRSALNDYFEEAFMSFQSRMERLAFS